MPQQEEYRVAASSNVNKVAGAIAHAVRDDKDVSLVAMGAGAVNQSVKALTNARGMVATSGRDLMFTSGFEKADVDGRMKTLIRFRVHVDGR